MAIESVDGQERVQWGTLVMQDTATACEKKDGGTYPGAEILWKFHGQGKAQTTCVHEKVFGNIIGAKAVIEGLEKGDEFCMLQVKSGDYWNIKEFAAGRDTLQAAGVAAPAATGNTSNSGYRRGEFPVPPTDMGHSICRQNALGHAISVIKMTESHADKSASEVVQLTINIAREFAAFTTGNEG
jgi:hypothetical protein